MNALTELVGDTEKENPDCRYPIMTKSEEEALIKQHERLIRSTALSATRLGVFEPLDDLIQEGRIALLLAMRRWDPNQGSCVWTHARLAVVGAMLERARRRNMPLPGTRDSFSRVSSTAQLESVDAVDQIPDESLSDSSLSVKALSVEECDTLFKLLGRLSPRELEVVKSILVGASLEEVATSLDISVTHTHRIREGAVTKMREAS